MGRSAARETLILAYRQVPQRIVRRVVQSAHLGEDLGDLSSIENPEAIERIRSMA